MSLTLADLEAARTKLLQQFLSLGDFRPGTVSAIPRRCGKPTCHCARRNGDGHPQFRLLRKVRARVWPSRLPRRPHFAKRPRRCTEYHRFQDLAAQLTTVNEQICRLRSGEPDEGGWTEAEKKRLLQFIKKSHGKSRHSSR